MPSRASPYGVSLRRTASRNPDDSSSSSKPTDELTYAQRVCTRIQIVLQHQLASLHCIVTDVSSAELQYRLLGPKRYWHRSIKQEKTGKRWEAKFYELALRRSTLERLRTSITSWHHVARVSSEDVQLRSLGLFDSEKQATQAFDTAFRVRDLTNALSAAAYTADGRNSARIRTREPLMDSLATQFQVVVVSEAFARRPQRQRLEMVYEVLLEAFKLPTDHLLSPYDAASPCRVRGFALIGNQVASLPHWRSLPFNLSVIAKSPSQWKTSSASATLSHTERFGLSHLQNDRALNIDRSILPVSRGLANLLASSSSSNQQDSNAKLPHFYHGLPDELKRMIADEQTKADEFLASAAQATTATAKAFQKLSKNTEAGFLPKYLKRRRELTLAATRLQRVVRRHTQTKTLRQITRRHHSALHIQRVFRSHRERVFVKAYRKVMNCASIIVQAVYRSYASRQRTKQLRLAMHRAAREIQRVYRGHVDRKYARWVRHMTSSAIAIERVVRGFMARRRVHRIRRSRHKRTVLIPSAIIVQRVWRGVLGRRIAQRKREIYHKLYVLNPAALKIERLLRGFLARRVAKKFRIAWESARVIQKHWRSHRYYGKWMALMELRRQHKMATRIGALGRGFVARQFFKREKRRLHFQFVLQPAAVRIQRVFRGYVVRKQHEDIRDRVEAAITLQQMWRKRSRIQTIQTKLRGFRQAIRHASATRIQYWYRCCKARQLLSFRKAMQRATHGKAVLVIQCAWRSYCSRVQLREFRFCSRIERKAQALTKWKEHREDIEFDILDARTDLKRMIKYKAKSLRRIKELKEMRLEWERRQPVVEKELSELTQEDLDRGWGEAFQTEKHVLRFTLELSVEDILGRKQQIREYESEIEDLRLELEDLERDLEECILDETMELESYRDMEMQNAHKMFAKEKERKIRLQRVRWGVRNNRKNVVFRGREDLQAAERELLAQRQVQELGALGFERKLLLKEKIESAIERVVHDRAKQSEVMMEMGRDAKVVAGFDDAIQRMSKITSQYSYEYRLPKQDMRDVETSPMCEGCGRITCDCDELEAKRVAEAHAKAADRTNQTTMTLELKTRLQRKKSTMSQGINYGHPLRRKRNYEQQ